jgi:hypothetical protein
MTSPFRVLFAGRLSKRLLLTILFLPLISVPLNGKTSGLIAIEIYPGHDGPAFEQIADLILNGKNEVLLCASTSGIDKSAYHKLAKVTLAPGMSLERDAKGVLMLSRGSDPTVCVVPGDLKFDKGGSYSAAELADMATAEGRLLPGSDPPTMQMVPLKAGVKLVFVAGPDQEMAEYLRAERGGDIRGWKSYLAMYGSGPHRSAANKSLAALLLQVANTDLQAYGVSSGADRDYAKLKDSRQMVDEAKALVPDDGNVAELNQKIHGEVVSLSSQAKAKLDVYQQALTQETPGYVNLVSAEKLADGACSVEPSTPEAASVETESKLMRARLDKILHDTQAQIAAQRADDAAQKITPIRAFAAESLEVSSDLRAISDLYIEHAKKLEATPDWPGAVTELEKATAVVSSPENQALLAAAQQQAQVAASQAAVAAAMQKSQASESGGDIIAAYEVLDDLPSDQRASVTERLNTLKDQYVQAAEQSAKGLQKAHEPINAIVDEVGIQRAYGYLQRCYLLTNDPTLQDRILILGDELSAYYLQQAKKYVEKPDGTGVNVGWTYLTEALQYKAQSSAGAVHDEMTTARPAYLLKSRLSVRVNFRDQTSRRDAVDFQHQLTDALANGLESSGLVVKVIREQDTTQVQPNFQMVGDVLKHESGKSQEVVPKESEYRAGEQEIPNEAWNQANRDYERANNDLQSARAALEGAQAHGKKNEIKDINKTILDDEKKVEELHAKLDMIPKTKAQDVIRPYTYTQVIYHLKIALELQFRILDSTGSEAVERIPISREQPREYSILQNVNPEDTKGVRTEGVVPNENEYVEEAENMARDELIEKAKQKVAGLPGLVLSKADRKAADGDNDGAAELYILYLNSTPVADTPERLRARKFLADQYNFRDIGKGAPSE